MIESPTTWSPYSKAARGALRVAKTLETLLCATAAVAATDVYCVKLGQPKMFAVWEGGTDFRQGLRQIMET